MNDHWINHLNTLFLRVEIDLMDFASMAFNGVSC